ncbi:hypothetical protein N9N28_08515 [Rubripirellula amarantea]|nr:hypothetical protein [Rubripirellula amarantea]
MRLSFVFLLAFFLPLLPTLSRGGEPIIKSISVDVDDIELNQRVPDLWRANIQVGEVGIGEQVAISCRLPNLSSQDVVVTGVDPSYACTKVEIPQNDWFSGDDLVIKAEIKVPDSTRHTIFTSNVTVHLASENPVNPMVTMHVVFVMDLGNLLSFKAPYIPVAVSQEMPVTVTMPLLCTLEKPVLSIASSNKVIDSASRIVLDEKTWTIILKLPPSKDGVSGDLTVSDKTSGLSCKTLVSVDRISRATISPTLMRAFKQPDGSFVMTGICRVRSADAKTPLNDTVAVQVRLGGKDTPLEVTNIGNGVARIKLKLKPDQVLTDDGELPTGKTRLDWTIWAGKESWNVSTSFICSSNEND